MAQLSLTPANVVPEYFEELIPAIDALTDKQAIEQIGERFS